MPENNDIMSSNLKLVLDQDNQTLSTGVEIHESLGVNHSDRYEYVFPYYDFSKTLETNKFDGTFSFSNSGSNNLKDTNILTSTLTNSLSYDSKNYFSNIGFKNNFGIYFNNTNIVGKNDPRYRSTVQSELMNIVNFTSELPLIKKESEFVFNTLTPKISLSSG